MLSFLLFALLDCETFLSNLHPCERGVLAAVLAAAPQPPSFVPMGILRAIALECDLRCLCLQPQLCPETPSSLQMYG